MEKVLVSSLGQSIVLTLESVHLNGANGLNNARRHVVCSEDLHEFSAISIIVMTIRSFFSLLQ